jgi:hypothetical protein
MARKVVAETRGHETNEKVEHKQTQATQAQMKEGCWHKKLKHAEHTQHMKHLKHTGGDTALATTQTTQTTQTHFPHPPLAPVLAFDLELSGLPTHWPTDGRSPVRVLCAATARYCVSTSVTGDHAPIDVHVWRGTGAWMTPPELCAFVDSLAAAAARGDTIVTWGGAGSDWRVLAGEIHGFSSTHAALCATLALDHVDVAFAAAASFGCMMGLRAACVGMDCVAKLPTASAAVPLLWSAGRFDEVLQHVADDAFATASVYARMFSTPAHPQLTWMTVRGLFKTWDAPVVHTTMRAHHHASGASTRGGAVVRLETVRECLANLKISPKFFGFLDESLQPQMLAAWLQVPASASA